MGKTFDWDPKKNTLLIKERGISFETIVAHIENGDVLAVAEGKGRYKHQKQFLIEINKYVYVVPCVETEDTCFLKTIIPSRKMTKQFLSGGEEDGKE